MQAYLYIGLHLAQRANFEPIIPTTPFLVFHHKNIEKIMVYYTYTIPCAFGVIGNFAANQLEDDMTEVIVMESVAYQKMMGQIAKIAEFITKNEHKLQEGDSDNDVWLDSQEVADMLHISTRTLQRLRSEGLIEYSVFRRKCLYKLSEIERKVREKVITCEPHLVDVYKKNRLLNVTGMEDDE